MTSIIYFHENNPCFEKKTQVQMAHIEFLSAEMLQILHLFPKPFK